MALRATPKRQTSPRAGRCGPRRGIRNHGCVCTAGRRASSRWATSCV